MIQISGLRTLKYQGVVYENYDIDENGTIRNHNTGYELSRILRKNGRGNSSYLVSFISLGTRHSSKTIILHRAVAETFLANPNKAHYVVFKDNNYENIHVSNLCWSLHRTDIDEDEYKARRRKSQSRYVVRHRKKTKKMAVDYLGGKCCMCGYFKCLGALEFHHKNPEEKDFAISSDGITKKWSEIKSELDKCICVCANCHREIHSK